MKNFKIKMPETGNMRNKTLIFAFLFLHFAFATSVFSKPTVIKFATLAPEGSTWMKVMEEWNKELKEKSNGQLKFRIYAGGISGDEKDVVRKIRFGQLHAGGFTGVGLGVIAPSVRILDAPFLFRSHEEVDHITRTFRKEWEKAFRENGYLLLGWSEVGFVYFFTNVPLKSLFDLKKVKMWMWEGDPIAEAAFKSLGVSPIPLSIADVMTSLQTGLINGVYSSPMGAIALQWFTRIKYMYDFGLAHASGAVLISRPFFKRMPEEHQTLLLATGKKYMKRLTVMSRKENKESIQVLSENGVRITASFSEEDIKKYETIGRNSRRLLVGRLYEESLLDQIESSLQKFRAK